MHGTIKVYFTIVILSQMAVFCFHCQLNYNRIRMSADTYIIFIVVAEVFSIAIKQVGFNILTFIVTSYKIYIIFAKIITFSLRKFLRYGRQFVLKSSEIISVASLGLVGINLNVPLSRLLDNQTTTVNGRKYYSSEKMLPIILKMMLQNKLKEKKRKIRSLD